MPVDWILNHLRRHRQKGFPANTSFVRNCIQKKKIFSFIFSLLLLLFFILLFNFLLFILRFDQIKYFFDFWQNCDFRDLVVRPILVNPMTWVSGKHDLPIWTVDAGNPKLLVFFTTRGGLQGGIGVLQIFCDKIGKKNDQFLSLILKYLAQIFPFFFKIISFS